MRAFHQRHAAHLQIDGQFLLVNGEQRQIYVLDIALPDGTRGQVHVRDAHVRLGASDWPMTWATVSTSPLPMYTPRPGPHD
jgi:hypothetical protein